MNILKQITLVITIIGMFGCSVSENHNNLTINENDKITILNYLNTKTKDINYHRDGELLSEFKTLGTDSNSIYIYLVQGSYIVNDNNEIEDVGPGVSLPVALKVKRDENNLVVINHLFPEDGKNWGRSVRKLFPKDIEFPKEDEQEELFKNLKKKAKDKLLNENK